MELIGNTIFDENNKVLADIVFQEGCKEKIEELFFNNKSRKEVAIKMQKLAEELHDSPNSFILHIFNFIDSELGEGTTNFVKDKYNRIFDELYSK